MIDVGIVGGGPAGLSVARFLKDAGARTVVFESEQRVGGKNYTVERDGGINELGTCYTTLAHGQIKAWMREEGVKLNKVGRALYDDMPVSQYVRAGGGASLVEQVAIYEMHRRRLVGQMHQGGLKKSVLNEAAMSTREWLQWKDLKKIERVLFRTQVAQGFGYLEDTAIIQTMGWCDLTLLASGGLNLLEMPDVGWEEFWRRFSSRLEVRRSQRVVGLQRNCAGTKPVHVCLEGGQSIAFDAVVIAAPLDDVFVESPPSQDERGFIDAVEWQSYATSLIASRDWFSDVAVKAYSSGCNDRNSKGRILGGRLEGQDEGLGGRLYVVGQIPGEYTALELQSLLRLDAEVLGFTVETVLQQKRWKYFPQYSREAIRHGLYDLKRSLQGKDNVWYCGAMFSHELVSSVVGHSRSIARRMASTYQL